MIFPTSTNNFNVESLRGQSIAKMLRDTVQNVQTDIGKRLYEICLKYNNIHIFLLCIYYYDYYLF